MGVSAVFCVLIAPNAETQKYLGLHSVKFCGIILLFGRAYPQIRKTEVSEMKYPIDLHTHTVASGHAYSTFKENTDHALKIGLEVLGVSDHAPAMPYGATDYYFINISVIPRQYGSLRLLVGSELNILDYEGSIDLKEYQLKRTDYNIASLHPPCISPGSVEENTAALIGAIKNPYVNIIGHPCDPRYPFDMEAVVRAAVQNDVLLEVNNASYNKGTGRAGGEALTVEMLKMCKKFSHPVILGSDAHFYSLIGDFSQTLPLLEAAEMPDELVINTDVQKTLDIIDKKRRAI